jgi:hypothetical protein|tara:strand:+ start:3489 stop:3986 length:498 start_codon:yes stop_codon:yes gene_type:complete
MGKKKSNERGKGGVGPSTGGGAGLNDREFQAVADAGAEFEEEEAAAAELVPGGVKTTNVSLQARLTLLATLGANGDIDGFVKVFVPHDLTQEDTTYFAGELKEDATRWKQLVEELSLIANGSRVTKIVGDQVSKAEFRYFMPNQELSIHREVMFTCENGDWRADG